ncbi:MAG: M20/M25/M40 family metallo-hydrolase [Xanthomonadales bacterium]|nr:M20/M25/M40 family metallo-hydrolase [Xanthomonadales bacterium]
MPRPTLCAPLAAAVIGLAALLSPTMADALDAETRAEAIAVRETAMQGSQAYRIVESLTTEIGPRLGGSPDYARAVVWAEAKLKALGFDRVWTQPLTMPLWTRRHERARVLGAHEQALLITALGHSVGTHGPLRGDVIELADIDALKAITDDSLHGKIVFLSHDMVRARDGSGYSKASSGRGDGPAEASKRGAVAFLLRSAGTDGHRFPHTGNTKFPDGVTPIPAAALSNPDADQIERLLDRGPVEVELDIDVGVVGEVVTHNVIGEIRGRKRPDEIVLLGAHLDSWDLGTGAIDDGAGIGITFAAGAQIAAMKTRPDRSIRVVAFAAEEVGLYGAKAYADAAQLDGSAAGHLIGFESDFGAGRIYRIQAGVRPDGWDDLSPMTELLRPLGIVEERRGGGPGADIGPLRDLGVAWLSLSQDGTDYFDYHHTADDTLDKIDPLALDQQIAAYATMAWLLANGSVDLRPPPPKKP